MAAPSPYGDLARNDAVLLTPTDVPLVQGHEDEGGRNGHEAGSHHVFHGNPEGIDEQRNDHERRQRNDNRHLDTPALMLHYN